MKPVDITYYAIQHRLTHKGPWLNPLTGKIKPIKPKGKWAYSCWDSFGEAFNPHVGTDNNFRPKDKKVDADRDKVWQRCGKKGFLKIEHAISAIVRAKKWSDKGRFDSIGTYGVLCQERRYEFRIMKCHITATETVVHPGK